CRGTTHLENGAARAHSAGLTEKEGRGMQRSLSRRLALFGLVGGVTAMLAACGAPSPTPEPPKAAEPTKPAAAAAGATPAPAANLLKVNVLKDLAPQWNSLSDDYRKQFSPAVVKLLNRDGKTWGLPYTTFATIVYRNLTVLEKAGIDAAAGIKDWNDWLAQAK